MLAGVKLDPNQNSGKGSVSEKVAKELGVGASTQTNEQLLTTILRLAASSS